MNEPTDEIKNLDDVIGVLRDYLDKRNTSQLEINRRLDFLVGELGGIREIGHRVELIEERLQRVEVVAQTQTRVLVEAQESFDTRTQMVLKDAEVLRGTVREATTAFQQAQEDQNADWDEKWSALRRDMQKMEEAAAQAKKDEATITVARIGRSEKWGVAIITVICGALVSLISTLILQQAGR